MSSSSPAPPSTARVLSSLAHLDCASAGHMFSSSPHALPLSLAHSILDFVDLTTIAVSVAGTSRGWYANCAAYALVVQSNATREDSSTPSHRLGSRFEECRLRSTELILLLSRSRLRMVVTSLVFTRDVLPPSIVSTLAESIPHLRSLECIIDAHVSNWRFPPRLVYLRLRCQQANAARMAEIAVALSQLRSLQVLSLRAYGGLSWHLSDDGFTALQSLPRLHTLDCGSQSVISVQRHAQRLAAFPALTSVVEPTLQDHSLTILALIQQMDPTHRLARLPLDQTFLTPALSQALLPSASTLTCLRPKLWMWHDDLCWLASLKALRQLRFVCFIDEHVDPTQGMIHGFISSLTALHAMENLCLKYAMLTDAHLETACTLPRLRYLTVHSKAITSLQSLSRHPHLARTLEALHLRVPTAPAEDIRHVLTLSNLQFLSVKGSFSGPLPPSALYWLQPPYPKRDSPVHWLRDFVPRSNDEPILPAALTAGSAVSVFKLYPAVLALVLSRLELKQFCEAASVSREWREAACLPAAWSGSSDVAPFSIGSGLMHPSMHRVCTPFVHSSRALTVRNTDPNWQPAYFSRLPLWRHLRSLTLVLADGGGKWINGHNLGPAQGLSVRRQRVLEESLASLFLLRQLESLSADWNGFKHMQAVCTMFVAVGPRLLRGHFVNLPVSVLAHFTRIQELHLRWTEHVALPECGCPGRELAALHSLRSIVLQGASWSEQLGSSLHALGTRHALRAVELCVEDPCTIPGSNRSRKQRLDDLRVGLVGLLLAIKSAPMISLILRLHTPRHFQFPGSPSEFVALRTLLPLAHLRRFEVHAQPHRLDSYLVTGLIQRGLPLESLTISASPRGETLRDLTFFTNLKELRIIDVYKPRAAPNFIIAPPLLKLFAAQLPLLEVLLVDSVQLPSGDLKHLADLRHLRTLVLCSQHFLVPADYEVLSRLSQLAILQLEMNALHLGSIVGPDRTLLSVIRDCQSLRLFRWGIEGRILGSLALAHDAHHCAHAFAASRFQLTAEMSRQRSALRPLLSDRLRIEVKRPRQGYEKHHPPRLWVPLQSLPAVAATFPRSAKTRLAMQLWIQHCETDNQWSAVDSLMATFLPIYAAQLLKIAASGRVCSSKYGCGVVWME